MCVAYLQAHSSWHIYLLCSVSIAGNYCQTTVFQVWLTQHVREDDFLLIVRGNTTSTELKQCLKEDESLVYGRSSS